VTDSLAGKVLQTKRAIAIGNDSQQWKRTHTALLVKSLIYVPLILQNKPIGVLGVANRIKETSFDSNDTRALSALAGYATIAINTANQFSQMEVDRNILRAFVEQNDDPILVLDEDARLVLLNGPAQRAFKLNSEDTLGRPLGSLIDNQKLINFVTQPVSTGTETEMEITAPDEQTYTGRLTLIKGGGRSLQLHPNS
jgi:transcriptional regulator with PAS, ATPase and Fis domain